MQVIIHIYMETSQGKLPVYSYIKYTEMSFLFFLFFLQNLRIGGQNRFCLVGVGASEWGSRRVNRVQILCTHVCKWKSDIC
jgi:hypothetical protein